MGPRAAGFVLGIVKAYTTRVGSGPFPTEQDNDVGQKLGERGHEFGTVTGRNRRCGWFDAVLVRQAVAVSGVTGIALTKLDVLDGFETIKICTGYTIGGSNLDYLPPHAADQARVEPIYEEIEGWPGSTHGARSWADLPARAIKYVRRIEELIRCPVALVSTSPERDDTILVRDPFAGASDGRDVRRVLGLHADDVIAASTWWISPVTPDGRSESRYSPAPPTSSIVTLRRSGELYSFHFMM